MTIVWDLRKMKWLIAFGILCIIVTVMGYLGIKRFYPLEYSHLIEEYSRRYNLEPAFVCAVIHAESKFRQNAVSNKGASGLMQLTRETADWLASYYDIKGYSYENIFEPKVNIELGCAYLRMLMDRYDDDTEKALAAYNAGPSRLDSWLDASGNLNDIPYVETRNFVSRVNTNMKIYKVLLMFR